MVDSDNNQDSVIEKALKQFVDAYLRGERPDTEEFVRQYPDCEDLLRQRIQNLLKINTLFDTLVQMDESDFGSKENGHALVGQTVGSFEIVEIIGRGGMGVVYLARDTKLDRSVAIKSIPSELQASSTAQARFKREAKLLASLNHPNIAVIHEIIEQEEGASYLVLEYVPGQTLAQRIAHKPLQIEEALSIGQQVAEAVSAAHEKGVVHRDLKPGNIKITPEGRVKVLDFGLAKASTSEVVSEKTTVTQPGRVIGTPAYMSPEQARGKPTDKRCDIWSLGCMMYEMLTGSIPFEGETATDTLARILEREPDWKLLPEETPANIRVLLRRCLEKDPNQRLNNINDVTVQISDTLSKPVMAQTPAVSPRLRRVMWMVGASIIIVLLVFALRLLPEKQTQPSLKEIRLVVLPFENLDSAEDEYFADGITDAITARLGSIHGLGVISRQSAMQYKNSEKSAQVIGRELGVDYILEGTVQRERPSDPNSTVRIIPQLVSVSDDTHVWSDIYDDDMSEVFRLQSDIAEQVAQGLDITLLEPERRTLASRPTENAAAYEYYLRGNEYFYRGFLENDIRIAIRMYKKAVELDPTFALAFAKLSRAHVFLYWLKYDLSEERLALAKQAVDKALQLNSDLPEARLALGVYYYHGHLDYNSALEQFAIALKSQPNNSDFISYIGFVQNRQGKFEQALTNIKRAFDLDPRSEILAHSLADTFFLLRNYPKAKLYYDRAISIAPDAPLNYYEKAWLYLYWQGSTEKARVVLEEGLDNIKSTENPSIINSLVNIHVFDGNYQQALTLLSSWSLESFDMYFYFIPKAQLNAQINGLMGNRRLEQANYESARSILESKIAGQPEDARFHSSLGIVYAGMGREEDAIREGKLGVKLLPVSKDAMSGLPRVEDLARIYVMVGKFDAAIDQLEFLLSNPGWMSIPFLQLDPIWNPLRDYPRFKRLLG